MKKIENPSEIVIREFDGVSASGIYGGGLSHLKLMNYSKRLKWRSVEGRTPEKVLTLDEIAEQLGGHYYIITVIVEHAFSGEIYQWGNYGDEWWHIGTLDGYA